MLLKSSFADHATYISFVPPYMIQFFHDLIKAWIFPTFPISLWLVFVIWLYMLETCVPGHVRNLYFYISCDGNGTNTILHFFSSLLVSPFLNLSLYLNHRVLDPSKNIPSTRIIASRLGFNMRTFLLLLFLLKVRTFLLQKHWFFFLSATKNVIIGKVKQMVETL